MNLKMGIVGLPNVGKSSLFNAITNLNVDSSNYPFATIEPNIGVVEVPDNRLKFLTSIFQPKKTVPAYIKFVDIAGLIKGASKGEGLGNTFLSNIRDSDAICMVVRCFENQKIIHVESSIDPIRDVEIINLELLLSDQEVIEKRISKIAKKAQLKKDKIIMSEYEILEKLHKWVLNNNLIKNFAFSKEELKIIDNYNFLTQKKFIYVANVAENNLNKNDVHFNNLQKYLNLKKEKLIKMCIDLEGEISTLTNEEKEIFLSEYNIEQSGLDNLIRESYKLLDLQTYFTAGKDEVKAWTYPNNFNAAQCAGVIHTDFEKGFIKADIYAFSDLEEYKSEKALREAGKIRSEGRSYLVQDGDVCFFKFNV
ncbi:redox-regulated ATPase YchF [Spiroplasma endosymbiont of Amphibalanus improvisus]|uniref:redox-regulated ATPase YchF n=1 Tax=Spiroplasma endosymbiont of Amphibalanus improvisus TaxID=3066327 RepID=UPI00313EC0A4